MLLLAIALHATPAETVDLLSHADLSVTQQAAIAALALDLPKYKKSLTAVVRSSDAITRQQLIATLLTSEATQFIERSCNTTMKELSKLTMPFMVAKCRLYEQRLLPAQPTIYLQRASVLLSAFLIDVLRDNKASKPELKLARWVAYLDADGPGVKEP